MTHYHRGHTAAAGGAAAATGAAAGMRAIGRDPLLAAWLAKKGYPAEPERRLGVGAAAGPP